MRLLIRSQELIDAAADSHTTRSVNNAAAENVAHLSIGRNHYAPRRSACFQGTGLLATQ